MIDRELSRNGSGYVDPTAYAALMEVQKGERKMDNKTGELWEITTKEGYNKECIIIADRGSYSTVLCLYDEPRRECDIKVNCRGMKYTSGGMPQYAFDSKITEFIRKLSDQEFEEIMDKVADALGMNRVVEVPILSKLLSQPVAVETEPIYTAVELERTKAQLEVYKGLYENLLKDVLQHG